jgi:TRAP-type C4-dicarboxylate transport system substrate-binding protein
MGTGERAAAKSAPAARQREKAMKRLVALAGTCAMLSGSGASAEVVKLTIVAAPPPAVSPVKAAKERFVPEVNRLLAASGRDFRIEWTEAYSQSLAGFNEVFEAVEEGIAHVGVVLKQFEESKLPLEQYMYMVPFMRHTGRQMIQVDANLHAKIPEMKAQYDKHNQVFLVSGPSAPQQMISNFPIRTVDDLKGRKIGASGAMGHWLRGTGAVIVTAAMTQSYTDIKNGVYDGYPMAITLAFPYRTYEAAPYLTMVDFGVLASSTLTVHKPTWAKLPQHAREALMAAAGQWPYWMLELDEGNEAKWTEAMVKKGLKIGEVSPAERRRWAMQMPNIAQEWAAALEKDGHPGRRVVGAYMDEVRALGVEIARHWDRE